MKKAIFKIYVEDYNVPLSPWCIINDRSFSSDLSELTGGKQVDTLLFFEKDFVIWGPNEKQFLEVADYFGKRIDRDRKFLNDIYKGHYEAFGKTRNLAKTLIKENLKTKTNKELYKIYQNWHSLFAECWKWSLVIQFLDMGTIRFSEKIKDELFDKLKRLGNPEVVFSKLITPMKETVVSKESLAILKLLKRIQADKGVLKIFKQSKNLEELPAGLQRFLRKLAKDYGWLQYYFLGPPAGANYYYDSIKKRLRIDADKEISRKVREEERLKKFQKSAVKLFNRDELYKIRMLREFSYLKEARKEIQVYYLNYAMHNWFSEVARRFYWSPLQAKYVTKDEYKDILLNNKDLLGSNLLNERYKCCAHILYKGKVKLYTGKKARELKKMFIRQRQAKTKNIKELVGTTAYPGRVKGAVKIINSAKDLEKFNDNDILVSFSTNPSLVPAMNRAAAIVTNTGGVTCHAAIVSRELRTPCIIGTNIATKILCDGDLVEVDADKGVVKILKKK